MCSGEEGPRGLAHWFKTCLEARGYTVKIVKRRGGLLDILAVGGDRVFIAVVRGRRKRKVTARDIRRVVETAQYLSARPVLAVPRGAVLTREARRLVRKLGVELRRLPTRRRGGR